MTVDERLIDLLMQAEELRQFGRSVDAAQLCWNSPELQPALEQLLGGMPALENLLTHMASCGIHPAHL
ncbi:MAG TPA: hypothetical protein VKU02_30235 [Gemmataceae bacterium]|nr:hypothetical protein [Gemmataceae bacterium]